MSGSRNKWDSPDREQEDVGVIDMNEVVDHIEEQLPVLDKQLVERAPKDALELRKMIGTRSIPGRTLVDLYKENR
ncbi:hypothetical protein [Ectobacillus ponti]|uniref:Uncharacterized protein n=1 Tax=Ectobacillus ponti TaxID=2961894 RepID=A0AA42BR43_9BACI|nr:hypothetical protein [Ectobacillus ponti]MCP8970031.1 hypothetical protein [Ectobacillus ponti]